MITLPFFSQPQAHAPAHQRRRRALPATVVMSAVSLLTAVAASGASTQVWELSEYKDFLRGRFENVSLLQPGTLTPAPKLIDLFTLNQPVIWTVATAPDGTIYVGTGHQGRVYRLDADNNVTLFWSAPEIEVFALAVGPEGEVYAGTSPNGKLYRISAEGEGKEIFNPEQTYIWSLVVAPASGSNPPVGSGEDKARVLYMATGGEGKIFQVDASRQGRVFAETKQRHVVSLAVDAEGRLLAGTDPNGIAYRIDADGRLFALHDSDLPEIRSLAVASNGDIYAAAMGGGASRITQSVSSLTASAGANAAVQVSAAAGGPAAPATSSGGGVGQPMVSVSQPLVTYPGMERSALLRIRPGQGVEKLWSSSEENILAVGVLNDEAGGDLSESPPPRVLFATDRKGRIYELKDRRKVSLVTESGREQVTQLAGDAKGLLVASAHSAGLSRFEDTAEAAGTYESAIHDAKTLARWGRLTWQGDGVGPGRVTISTRAGNSAVPDDSWSEWSRAIEAEPDAAGEGPFAGAVSSPRARYIQWRATLETKNESAPLLRSVRLAYLPRNSPPSVSELKIEASAGNGAATSAAGTAAPASAPAAEAAYSITVSASGSSTAAPAKSTTQTTLGSAGRGMKISWKATDPDGDKLTASVAFRETTEAAWKTIKNEIEAGHLSLDSESLADGTYRFRIVVSDSAANPPETARATDQISEPVLIDHTPPRVSSIQVDGRDSAAFEATDDASALAAAEYAVDAGNWVPVFPADGILDSRRESFTIPLDDLPEGEHLLTLRVRDSAGNAGLGKATIR